MRGYDEVDPDQGFATRTSSGSGPLTGKTAIVGVCGGIAAYKVPEVIRGLMKHGLRVYVIMTRAATRFITPLTFRTVSRNPVFVRMFEEPKLWDVEHIALAERADLFLVVPATADIIGKVASGIADDYLSTTIMACGAPVIFAPAMNSRMWENPIVQANVSRLEDLGYRFIGPERGELACGTEGTGRLASPEVIVDYCVGLLSKVLRDSPAESDFEGVRILVTAGPTREYIDPVRFISNASSGKTGYEIAKAARRRGAQVVLISGPTALRPPEGVEFIGIKTADEMFSRVMEHFPEAHVVIKTAAVVDFTPENPRPSKVKKGDPPESWSVVKLKKTPDILASLGAMKGDRILVGFAAETENVIENALRKVVDKNLDFVVANDVSTPGLGFGSDQNAVSLVYRDQTVETLPVMAKRDLADVILDRVKRLLESRNYDRPE
ncbi:MAG TPA: bifunctional phosphopantothenoylcysteine decarboxylase/phosphopantothenate--cysteine ligase CoaBC [Clostridia bacterium]|nr:bifunctional phosphopantothenoylcysteine decarboxylase/phosphopantothenate--cysteine ligase CoaBC [Clostridia bacterium]